MDNKFTQFLVMLVLVLAAARLCGSLARRLGQPAVLGELLAGVLVGPSVLGVLLGWPVVDPANETLHHLAELGVVVLLFEIGLETDLGKLLSVGPTSLAVAVVGVAAPFALGFLCCRLLGYTSAIALVAGATLTATSVGITARVLSELGRLQDVESQVILGAAVLDDVIGLVILAVVNARLAGEPVEPTGMLKIAALAFGFLILALLIGRMARPILKWSLAALEASGWAAIAALLFALALAVAAELVQPGLMIVGAFAAGLVLAPLPQVKMLERGLAPLGHFLVPIFFAVTGAAVDVRLLNPANPQNHAILRVGGLLLIAAILGKFVSGYAPYWFRGNKKVIGVGMIPRGEVGLIFANAGYETLGDGLYSALTLLVMITTFVVPPALKYLLSRQALPRTPPEPTGVAELTS